MVLSVIQGVALNTGVLPFSKGRALQVISMKTQTMMMKTMMGKGKMRMMVGGK
jgi:hypothetical protein